MFIISAVVFFCFFLSTWFGLRLRTRLRPPCSEKVHDNVITSGHLPSRDHIVFPHSSESVRSVWVDFNIIILLGNSGICAAGQHRKLHDPFPFSVGVKKEFLSLGTAEVEK